MFFAWTHYGGAGRFTDCVAVTRMEIEIRRGSLLDQLDVEVIVNAANRSMRGGGGIDGAVHRGAGPGLLEELVRVAPRGCPEGEVIITAGHNLPFRYIFHTPGPIWRGGHSGEPESLAACYRNCLKEAERVGIKSIGFCSISTGVFGYPKREAAKIALQTEMSSNVQVELVVFSLFGSEEFAAYRDTYRRILRESQ